MAILETKKGTAFYKTGPLYQQAEADRQAQENLRNSESEVESRNVTEKRGKDDRGTYTDYITTTNTKRKGKGESTKLPSYEEYAAKGGDVEEAKKWYAEQEKRRKETSTRRVYDKIETLNLPKPTIKLTTPDISAIANPKIIVKKPNKKNPELSLSGGTFKKSRIGKVNISINPRFSNRKSGKCPAGRKCKGAVNK